MEMYGLNLPSTERFVLESFCQEVMSCETTFGYYEAEVL